MELRASSLAGIWRFAFMLKLGGRPPSTLARPPTPAVQGGGPWKQYCRLHHELKKRMDIERMQVANQLAHIIIEILQGPLAEVSVHPLKPSSAQIDNINRNLKKDLGIDLDCIGADKRCAPLTARWECEHFVCMEAIRKDWNDFHIDVCRIHVSCFVSFAALAGQPRMFVGVAHQSQVDQSWDVDIVHVRLPGNSKITTLMLLQEILTTIKDKHDIASSLCGASYLCRVAVKGGANVMRAEVAHLATDLELLMLDKELFGVIPGKNGVPTSALASQKSKEHMQLRVLYWLMCAVCPDPFTQYPGTLRAVAEVMPSSLLHTVS
eukprot:TRINITY_DN15776_c0_g1_i2.p1 TRINITY_DN15776_c0_g1~~TRINITY_DN15776_c0_g1_i2.p1  ORF type:complete len:322 (-),score=56.81 TRINITY_DN15776_c0_g1_i2:449-1414(-)